MKTFIAALILSALLFSVPVFAATIGQPAPDFTGADSNGKSVSLSSLKGKTVVLEWVSNECPFVKKHYEGGNMQKLQKDAAANDVVWISVDSSAVGKPGYLDGPAANAWLQSQNATPAHFVIDASGDIGHLYSAKTTPHMYIIDKAGTLVYAGAIDSKPSTDAADIATSTNYVQAALDNLKAGQAVAVAQTQSYGCGIKYGSGG